MEPQIVTFYYYCYSYYNLFFHHGHRSTHEIKLCYVCQGVPTPPKKRRLTSDSMLSGCSTTLAEDSSNVDRHMSVDEQFESRRRMLASRNLFEVSE